MCSTFKVLLVAAILARVDGGTEHFDRHVSYASADLLENAPIAKENLGLGYMSVYALCEAAIEYSDNTAANLLLRAIGGPRHVTAYASSMATRTRLDRNEPSLNTAVPGDVRDTTTPAAMAANLRRLLTGNALSALSRRSLSSWMIDQRPTSTPCAFALPRELAGRHKTGLATTRRLSRYRRLRRTVRADPRRRHGVLAEVGRIISVAFG